MVTVSTKRLMEAIEEADAFALPEMNGGMRYLYDNVYTRLAGGGEVTLSGVDFGAFKLDDIGVLDRLYEDLEEDGRKAEGISRTLWGLPAVTAPAFV